MNEKIEINGVSYIREDAMNIIPEETTPIGHWCIVRTRDSGVWFAFVLAKEGRDATLASGRRLHSWKAANGFTLSAVSKYGLSTGRLSSPISIVFLTETCEFIPVSEEAKKNLNEWPSHNE